MNKIHRVSALLTLLLFAAAYDCYYVAPDFFAQYEEFHCLNPRWSYDFQWYQRAEWFIAGGLVFLFTTFLLWNRRMNRFVSISIDK